MGVLQIVGFTEKPKGVTIRYKLVQGNHTTTPAKDDATAARLKLESAERMLKLVEARYKLGTATEEEFSRAGLARDMAAAELKGDAAEAARVRLRYAEGILKYIELLHKNGAVGGEAEKYEAARLERDLAAAAVKKLDESNASKPTPTKPATDGQPDKSAMPQGPILRYVVEGSPAETERRSVVELLAAIDRRLNPGSTKLAKVTGISLAGESLSINVTLFHRNDADRRRVERLLLHPGELEFRILANTRDNKDLIDRALKQPKKSEVLDSSGERLAWWAPVRAGDERSFVAAHDIARRTQKRGKNEITEVLVLADPYSVTDEYLSRAKVGADSAGKPCIEFTLCEAGGKLFGKLTSEHLPDKKTGLSRKLGIILDGELLSAPAIQSTIYSRGIITGLFTDQDASDIADILNAGSLPMRLRLVTP